MERGRRSAYTVYLECHFRGHVVYVRRKTRFKFKDGWYEYRIIRSKKTIEKAIRDGYEIEVIKDGGAIPFEVEDEVERIMKKKNEKAAHLAGRTA